MLVGVTAPEFLESQALIQRLAGSDRPVVFLVGSALTWPTERSAGVPSVDGMLDLIRGVLGPDPGASGRAVCPRGRRDRAASAQSRLQQLDRGLRRGRGGRLISARGESRTRRP